MKSPLHILHLEDDPNDAVLIQATLEADGIICATTCVETRDAFVAALERGGFDLVLSDFSLPAFDGFSAGALVRAGWPNLPFILVSGTLGEERAIDSLKSGATDYVLKGRLARLVPAVRRAMQEVEAREERQENEKLIWTERNFSEASLNSLPGIFYLYDEQGKFLRWNRNLERISGYTAEEIAGLTPLDFFATEERDHVSKKIEQVFATGSANAEAHLLGRDGTLTPYYFTGQKVQMNGEACLIGIGLDISERRRLEAQFIEAQKMEVIGQLAGGVAHDFNNILSVIMGYSDLIAAKMDPSSPLRDYIDEIMLASERAVGLTGQLLIFSRKQTVQLVVLDLNEVVGDLEQMLGRLIGENIDLSMVPGESLGAVKGDAGYVGQVLMNLVVNARDAMPKGGKLTISTENVTFEQNDGKIPAGEYVMLSVSDTGTGMTEEVKAHLFEAFFTTKQAGRGTGLGLATCQTIIQQTSGHIAVESEPGQGTTFKIYFPRVEQAGPETAKAPMTTGPLPRGTETLLLVEDEPAVRHLACGVLRSLGYEVLSASNGQEGLHAARDHQGSPVCLVVTDVIMPLMGGKVMAEWLQATYSGLRVLYTSGYTDDAIAQDGVLDPGVDFLPKPYTPAALARKVREMLDR